MAAVLFALAEQPLHLPNRDQSLHVIRPSHQHAFHKHHRKRRPTAPHLEYIAPPPVIELAAVILVLVLHDKLTNATMLHLLDRRSRYNTCTPFVLNRSVVLSRYCSLFCCCWRRRSRLPTARHIRTPVSIRPSRSHQPLPLRRWTFCSVIPRRHATTSMPRTDPMSTRDTTQPTSPRRPAQARPQRSRNPPSQDTHTVSHSPARHLAHNEARFFPRAAGRHGLRYIELWRDRESAFPFVGACRCARINLSFCRQCMRASRNKRK